MSEAIFYVGSNNTFTAEIRTNAGVVRDLDALGVSRVVLHLAGSTIDSTAYPSAIDYTTGGASGLIEFNLTGFKFAAGSYGARIVIYYTAAPQGEVVADGLPVKIAEAIAGIIPSELDSDDIFTILISNDVGSGSDRVGWVGHSGLTVTEALDDTIHTNTYATLTALTPIAGMRAQVAWRATISDGGGGVFSWDSTSTATENGGTILESDAGGTGRWLRQFTGPTLVAWFGALGDGATDDSTAIQAAIDSATESATVMGDSSLGFVIGTGLTLNKFITLSSFSGSLQSGEVFASTQTDHTGFTLLVTDTVNPAITVQSNSAVKGVRFFYPNQTKTNPPVTYPASIKLQDSVANDVSIIECAFPNSFYAIDAEDAHQRLWIKGVVGQPLNRGIVLDDNTDSDHLEDIHFWRYWDQGVSSDINTYINQNCVGVDLGNCDAVQGNNIFLYGMRYGIRLSDLSGAGAPYGNFTNISFDKCKWAIYGAETNGNGVNFNGCLIAADSTTESACVALVIPATAPAATRVSINGSHIWGGTNATTLFSVDGDGNCNIGGNTITTWGSSSAMATIKGSIVAQFQDNMVGAATGGQSHFSLSAFVGTNHPVIEGNKFAGPLKLGGTAEVFGLENNYEAGRVVNVASATALPVPIVGDFYNVTGTTTITSFTSSNQREGRTVQLIFAGILTLTHSASLVMAGSANLTTGAGDRVTFVYYSSAWREVSRTI